MTIARSRPHVSQRWLALFLAVGAASLLLLGVAIAHSGVDSIPANFFAVADQQGANDVPGQVDLTQMGRDDTSATTYKLFWSWDSTDQWTGTGQTGDACALFDNDNDGNINFVICVRVNNPGADPAVVKISPNGTVGPVYLFSCSDKKNDRCTGPTAVSYGSGDASAGKIGGSPLDPTANLITDTDPFGAVGANTPHDSTVEVQILKSKIPDSEVLVNVCSYPSAGNGGNNNPFDCILSPGAGFLKITKVAGDDTSTSFGFTIDPAPAPPGSASQTIVGSDSTGNIVMFIGSSYSVGESVPDGWSLVSSGCAIEGGGATGSGTNPVTSVQIVSGKVTTCTFTDSPILPKLTVTKVVVNDNGGLAVVGDFPLFVDGGSVTSGTQNSMAVGAHTVSETGSVGYGATITGDCAADGSITLALGDEKSCTITNDDIAPKLTVTKIVTNDDGGQAVIADFPLFVDGGSVTSGAENVFAAGAHTVSETGMTGYSPTIGGDCAADGSITLNPGDVKACSITNDDLAPKLTVTKIVDNDFGGSAVVADFPLFVDGNGVTSGVEVTLMAGNHTVSETTKDGYSALIGGDCSVAGAITLNPGDVKACTITNSDGPASPSGTTVERWVLHDSLTISGIRHLAPDEADATVTFRLWSSCNTTSGVGSSQVGSSEVIDLLGGSTAATEDGVPVTLSGTYYWTASYSGDAWNLPFATRCDAEITQILAKDAMDGGRDDFVEP